MRKYSNYKHSGIEWVGHIPAEWSVTKYKFVLSIKNGFPFKSELFDNQEGFPLLRIRDITSGKLETFYKGEFSDDFVIKKGDVVVGMDGDFNIRWWDHDNALLNQRCCAIKNIEGVTDLRFLYYLLPNDLKIINDLTYYTTVKHLSNGDINNSFIALPSLEEQTKIAQYLDHQTAIIDQLIQQKEKLIELLKEKRQAVINEAVTKGLNPKAKMKDTGIEWLGEVPEHWEVTKMKFIATITRGAILRPVDDPAYFDDNGEWTYLNISDATKCDKYLYEGKLRLSELGSTKSARVNPDNLILTASATIGKPFINKIPVCVHDGFIPITNIKCSIDYLYHYLRNPQLYIGLGKVNTQKNIYLDEVKDMFVTQPPMEEQYEIVSFLERFEVVNNNLLQQIDTLIEKLKEYRQSIISEAVTGKIDVRDWQPSKIQVA